MALSSKLLKIRYDVLRERLEKVKSVWSAQEHVDGICIKIDWTTGLSTITVSLKNKTKYVFLAYTTWVEDKYVGQIEIIEVERISSKGIELFNQEYETDLESVFAQML